MSNLPKRVWNPTKLMSRTACSTIFSFVLEQGSSPRDLMMHDSTSTSAYFRKKFSTPCSSMTSVSLLRRTGLVMLLAPLDVRSILTGSVISSSSTFFSCEVSCLIPRSSIWWQMASTMRGLVVLSAMRIPSCSAILKRSVLVKEERMVVGATAVIFFWVFFGVFSSEGSA